MGIVGAVVGAIGLGMGIIGQAKSNKLQKKAIELQNKSIKMQQQQDNLRAARERREAIRNARLAAGATAQRAANQGASGSSALLGALGSIDSQLRSGLSFLDNMNQLANKASAFNQQAAVYKGKAANWQGWSSIGMNVFNVAASGAFDGNGDNQGG